MAEILSHQLHGFDVRIYDEPTDDILQLLAITCLGTPGGLQYQLQDAKTRIDRYRQIYFVTLYRMNRLIGLLAVCPRTFNIHDQTLPAYYIRYLAMASPFQSKTEKGRKKKKLVREKLESSFKDQIIELFKNPSLLGLPGFDPEKPSLFYAYVDPGNIRSSNLVEQAGYQAIGRFYTLPFSRNKPKVHPGVRRSKEDESAELLALLKQSWEETNGWLSEFVLHDNNYFILEENGKIIAGVQAHPAIYKIRNLTGIRGFIFLKIIAHLPYFRKILNDKQEMHFLAFEGFFCEEGKEEFLPVLLESVCCMMDYHAGLCWFDERTPLCRILRRSKDMGLLGHITGKESIAVYTNFQKLDEDKQEEIKRKSFYISAFDSI